MSAWATLRTAAKFRRCRCGTMILAGDQYLEQVISPDHGDVGNTTWWRESECRACAVRYGRWPIPNGAVLQRE